MTIKEILQNNVQSLKDYAQKMQNSTSNNNEEMLSEMKYYSKQVRDIAQLIQENIMKELNKSK